MRRIAAIAASLALTASIGWAEAGSATAATPAVLRITNGSMWTSYIGSTSCEVDTFHSDHTFSSDGGDGGTWSGGRRTLHMTWSDGETFSGSWVKNPNKKYEEYAGLITLDGMVYNGEEHPGALPGC
jgi:hypothetical protein